MKIFKKISLHLLLLSLFIVPIFVMAQGADQTTPPPTTIKIGISNPFKCGVAEGQECTLMDLITALLNNVVMPIAAVGVVIWIIWAGFSYVMAQGNPAKIKEAHQRLLWSLIGAGILLGAAGISAVVQKTIEALIVPTT
jgi:hypothetical protein